MSPETFCIPAAALSIGCQVKQDFLNATELNGVLKTVSLEKETSLRLIHVQRAIWNPSSCSVNLD